MVEPLVNALLPMNTTSTSRSPPKTFAHVVMALSNLSFVNFDISFSPLVDSQSSIPKTLLFATYAGTWMFRPTRKSTCTRRAPTPSDGHFLSAVARPSDGNVRSATCSFDVAFDELIDLHDVDITRLVDDCILECGLALFTCLACHLHEVCGSTQTTRRYRG